MSTEPTPAVRGELRVGGGVSMSPVLERLVSDLPPHLADDAAVEAMTALGVSPGRMVVADAAGVSLSDLLAALESGVTYEQVLVVAARVPDGVGSWCRLRDLGARDETLAGLAPVELRALENGLSALIAAGLIGVLGSRVELAELSRSVLCRRQAQPWALDAAQSMDAWVALACSGVSVDETCEVLSAGASYLGYRRGRTRGVGHEACLRLARLGASAPAYELVGAGVSVELVAAMYTLPSPLFELAGTRDPATAWLLLRDAAAQPWKHPVVALRMRRAARALR